MNLSRYNAPTLRRLVRYAERHGLGDLDAVAKHLHSEHKQVVKHAARAAGLAEGTMRKIWSELDLPHAHREVSCKPALIALPDGISLAEYARRQGHPPGSAFYQRVRRRYHKTGELPVH